MFVNKNPVDKYRQKYGIGSIMTFTGKMVHPLELTDAEIDIIDIAHALSNNCRYGGHTRRHYSVAQHSVLASKIAPPYLALAGLLHDAAEAYFSDLVSPIKHLPEMKFYSDAEEKAKVAIWNKYVLPRYLPKLASEFEILKRVDRKLLRTEQRDLMIWHESYPHDELDFYIIPISAAKAEKEFLMRFRELSTQRVGN